MARILIVDDEPNIVLALELLMKREGYDILAVDNGEKVFEVVNSFRPDLILLDIMMPKMDGYTACREIKLNKTTRAIPVVMLTSLGYPLNKELGKDVGADGYITKPFDHQALLDVIHRFLPTS